MKESPLMTVWEFANACGMKPKTVRNWLCSGRIDWCRVGTRSVRIPRDQVALVVERHVGDPASAVRN